MRSFAFLPLRSPLPLAPAPSLEITGERNNPSHNLTFYNILVGFCGAVTAAVRLMLRYLPIVFGSN